MPARFDPRAYDPAFRPNYEQWALAGWGLAAVAAAVFQFYSALPIVPFYGLLGLCSVMALRWLPGALRVRRLRRSLRGRPVTQVTLAQLQKEQSRQPNALWLGYGFVWKRRHAQRVFEILKADAVSTDKRLSRSDARTVIGQRWIHGVEHRESRQYQSLTHTEGHTLILGTTGAGKTRLFDVLIAQAIARGEAVVILDPKGDHALKDNAEQVCHALGQPERFVYFHPAFPQHSVRLDPLRHFSQVTEIASRLAALIPSETGYDPFKSFGWQALNNIAQGLALIEKRPNLVQLRRFLEGGSEGLVVQAIQAYCTQVCPNWRAKAQPQLHRVQGRQGTREQAFALIRFYSQQIQPDDPNPDLEGLLSMFQHDSTHFSKMVASLLPIMNMLTSGDLGALLSPNPNDATDKRPITDTAKILHNHQVVYIGLNILSDPIVGSAIGSLLLSDLAAVAGDRYNYGGDNQPVNLFIDEAAEVINEPFIQLLNKGRGAGLRLWLAVQTLADFAARLGDKYKAFQVLGNVNNLIAMRVLDQETQEYVTRNLLKTRLNTITCSQSQTVQGETPVLASANQGERLIEEEADLFPAPLLGSLPNFEYLAKLAGGRIIKGRVPVLTLPRGQTLKGRTR